MKEEHLWDGSVGEKTPPKSYIRGKICRSSTFSAWNPLILKLDFRCRWKFSFMSRRL